MFVRLVVSQKHPASQAREGAISAAYTCYAELRNTDRNNVHLPRLNEALVRFEEELQSPCLEGQSSRAAGAIFWLKDDAKPLIDALWELKWALDACGIPCDLLTTRRPGKVLFEDANQIAAIPFPETGA